MNKQDLINKIKQLEGITDDERAVLVNSLNTDKKYGLIWEDKPEDVEEQLRTQLPVLREVIEKRILASSDTSEKKEKEKTTDVQQSLFETDDSDSSTPEASPSGRLGGAPNHILIEGDNLHALTALTFTHENKIDVIYIDPPYNTGNKDFKYNVAFVDKEDSYRHSKWLSFMHKRLQIAKRLLSDKGVIFISIDDNEVNQLKLLCDEIFSQNNFLSEFIIQSNPRGSQASKYFAVEHEYLLCFSKVKDPIVDFGLLKGEDSWKEYPLLDQNNKRYRLLGLRQRGGEWKREQRPNMYYPIYINPLNGEVNEIENNIFSIETLPKRPTGEESRWTWGPDKFLIDKSKLIGKKVNRKGEPDFWDIFRIDYLEKNDGENKKTKTKSIWNETEINYQNGGNEVKDILGPDKFSFPKPLFLLKKIIGICSYSSSLIIVDFFAGSGTTLHATLELNNEDGGNRQCILVTNNENNICEEVTYERNKRVIQGYTNAKGVQVEGLTNNNLRYYQSDYISRDRTNKNKRNLVYAATEMLCIKEDIYTELAELNGQKLNNKMVRCFSDKGKYMLVIYDEEAIENLLPLISAIDFHHKIKIYIFAPGQYPFTEEFEDVLDKVELCALPDAIYKAYANVLPKKKRLNQDVEENSLNQDGKGLKDGQDKENITIDFENNEV